MKGPQKLEPAGGRPGILVPLRYPLFRRIWIASLLSNLGILIMGVGAAWSMTQMTNSADMIALVQTALMLPVALVSGPAGAAADMFDRRKVALVALCVSLCAATSLTVLSVLHGVTPHLLLLLCFAIGSGMALFGPTWQASVTEQVPVEALPPAIALNGISYNIARSFGPAIGGVIVAAAGATSAFAVNAVCYIPFIVVLLLWQRIAAPSRLPPERLAGAVVVGIRYIFNSPPVRIVLGRTLITGIAGGSVLALMPLVARDLLHSGAENYGIMLGCFGLGAVIGALSISNVRARLGSERAVRLCVLAIGAGVGVVAASRSSLLTGGALVLAGAGWTASVTVLNIAVQLAVPRWVAGRAAASYQAAISGGIALGSWMWGAIAGAVGVETALALSSVMLLASAALGRWMRLPHAIEPNEQSRDPLADPDMRLSLTSRSGPIVLEIEYRIDPKRARLFYAVMQQVQMSRQRTGAYGWSIARDIADPELWTERFHCPTWLDYLRQRNRATDSERALHQRALEFHLGPEPIRIRRMLERPLGSVRWKEDTPDRSQVEVAAIVGPGSGS